MKSQVTLLIAGDKLRLIVTSLNSKPAFTTMIPKFYASHQKVNHCSLLDIFQLQVK
jgi:hypothetical protein